MCSNFMNTREYTFLWCVLLINWSKEYYYLNTYYYHQTFDIDIVFCKVALSINFPYCYRNSRLDISCSVLNHVLNQRPLTCTSHPPAAQCYDTTHTCDEAHLWRDNSSVRAVVVSRWLLPVIGVRRHTWSLHWPVVPHLTRHLAHTAHWAMLSIPATVEDRQRWSLHSHGPWVSWLLNALVVGCSFIILLSKIFFSGAIRRRDFWWSILTNIFDQQNLNELVFFVCILYLDNENLLFAIFPYQ